MKNIDFCITEDNSVGLFNREVNDIYHSTYGAYTESLNKFIKPSEISLLKNKKEINLLDICYGIGYNSKTLIDEMQKNNININLNIDALEIDKNLIFISPFIKAEQYNEITNRIILKNLIENFKTEYIDFINLIKSKESLKNYLSFDLLDNQEGLLHNIYYQYISKSEKNESEYNKINNFTMQFFVDDARKYNTDKKYDLIYLDAFTPIKTPILWSYQFFKKLYNFLANDGRLITYSSSAAVRNTMINAGFSIGKIIDKNSNNKSIGTIGVKDPYLIKNKLDNFDLGLLNTSAGVMFQDSELNFTNEEILFNRNKFIKDNKVQSTSSYIKSFNKSKNLL